MGRAFFLANLSCRTVSSCSPLGSVETEARQRRLDRIGTALQALLLRCRHFGLEHATHAFTAQDAWQGKRYSKSWVVTADGNHCSLIAQYHLGESRGDHPYAVLTGTDTFNDRDVGVPNLALDFLTRRLVLPKEVQYLPVTHSRR